MKRVRFESPSIGFRNAIVNHLYYKKEIKAKDVDDFHEALLEFDETFKEMEYPSSISYAWNGLWEVKYCSELKSELPWIIQNLNFWKGNELDCIKNYGGKCVLATLLVSRDFDSFKSLFHFCSKENTSNNEIICNVILQIRRSKDINTISNSDIITLLDDIFKHFPIDTLWVDTRDFQEILCSLLEMDLCKTILEYLLKRFPIKKGKLLYAFISIAKEPYFFSTFTKYYSIEELTLEQRREVFLSHLNYSKTFIPYGCFHIWEITWDDVKRYSSKFDYAIIASRILMNNEVDGFTEELIRSKKDEQERYFKIYNDEHRKEEKLIDVTKIDKTRMLEIKVLYTDYPWGGPDMAYLYHLYAYIIEKSEDNTVKLKVVRYIRNCNHLCRNYFPDGEEYVYLVSNYGMVSFTPHEKDGYLGDGNYSVIVYYANMWPLKRLLWIGMLKPYQEEGYCLLGNLNKDILRYIMSFLK